MFDAPQGVPDRRRILAVALTLYLALFLVPVALQWVLQANSRGQISHVLLRAEAGALARLQASLSLYDARFSGFATAPIESVFAEFPDPMPQERLIWLGETHQLAELRSALSLIDPAQAATLESLYLDPDSADPVTIESALAVAPASGFFHQAVLARAGDVEAAESLERSERWTLRIVATLAGAFVVLTLLGLGILTTGWFWLNRLHPKARFPPPEPGPFRTGDVYLLFVAWLALYMTLSFAAGILGLTSQFVVEALVATYLLQALGGCVLMWRLLASHQRVMDFFRSVLHGAGQPGWFRILCFGLGGYAVALPVVFGVTLLLDSVLGQPPVSENPLISILLETQSPIRRLTLLLTVAIIAPIFEELIFRGVLMPSLRRRIGPMAAIFVSGLIFAFIHLDLLVLIPLTALGCILGAVTYRSGSLIPAMVLHALWNAQSFLHIELLRWLAWSG